MNRKLRVIIFMIGFLICSFPFFASLVGRQYQKNAVATYKKEVESFEENDTQMFWDKAEEYNKILYQSYGTYISDFEKSILSDKSYDSILDISGNGIMGSVEIPRINVNLPIYHGTEESVLSIGIGHLQGTSFPIGGTDTRAVLTGHRGSPNSKLFTRLDELEENDLFFIRVLDSILAYKVIEIDVIAPEEVEMLDIEAENDLVSLVTCTPYGINSHRLVVTGERVEYTKDIYEAVEPEMMSARENIFVLSPFILFGIGVFSFAGGFVVKRKRR